MAKPTRGAKDTTYTQIAIPDTEYARLKAQAEAEHRTISGMVRHMILAYLDNHERA